MNSRNYISKHKKYIDYRINLISDYVSQAPEYQSSPVKDIMYFLLGVKINTSFPEQINEPLQELRDLSETWNLKEDGDYFGYLYQQLQARESKKKKGQYFTPPEVVSNIVQSLLASMETPDRATFLDPACGSGQFIIALYFALQEVHLSLGLSEKEAAEKILKEQITAFDIDPIAVSITRSNLSRISGLPASEISIFYQDFLFQENLLEKKPSHRQKQWDAVLGNPPWGSSLSVEQRKAALQNYTSPLSGINTFTLFIERALDYVTLNGKISFLIPEAYLNIKAHRKSRDLVLSHCKINEITIWGEQFKGVFAPSISILLTKNSSTTERRKNIVRICNSHSLNTNTAVVVPQSAYYTTHENIFNINYTRRCINILSSIEDQDCFYLKDRSRFYLGIVTGNNDRHISSTQSEEHPDPILTGKDVDQYQIRFSKNYFKYDKQVLQQVAPQHLYRVKNKILYKFIGKRLTFAHDTTGYYSLNNINGFIPEQDLIENDTLLSILNSDLMQYYYENSFFTLKVLRGNLEKLPIKPVRACSEIKLKKLVKDIAETKGSGYKKLRDNIEDIVFSEYNIKDREAYIISRK